MSTGEQETWFGSAGGYRALTGPKYPVYALLFMNIGFFLREELLALEHTFGSVWDASLWLFAFILTELNVFEWQYETSRVSSGTGVDEYAAIAR